MRSFLNAIFRVFNRIIDSGVTEGSSVHHRYRIRSINSFCFFCPFISSPYLPIFYINKIYLAFWCFSIANFLFLTVIWANYKLKYLEAKMLLVFTSNMSVLLASLMLGIESGFHLYIFTAALFVFWLFENQQIRSVILTFFVYVVLYLLIFYHSNHYFPIYTFYFRIWGLTMYDLNVILSLLLTFLLFYNYFTYYKLITKDLIDKQSSLEHEVGMRKRSEEETRKLFDDLSLSYKNLEQFSYVVSHNMRAPLANIKGFVSLYDKSRPGTEQNAQIIGYVETASNNLDDILSDLNFILKNRERALENKLELNFQEIVNEICQSLQAEMETTRARLTTNVSAETTIFTIKSALVNILYNLVQNSLKYRKDVEDPKVHVTFDNSDQYNYCIKIEDNGEGIDLVRHKDKVFKLYSRLNRNVDGKGIGLYLVKTQVEVLGGTIEIQSEPNKGTKFTIRLPK